MADFKYSETFQIQEDPTEYRLLTDKHVSVSEFEGRPVLKVALQKVRPSSQPVATTKLWMLSSRKLRKITSNQPGMTMA